LYSAGVSYPDLLEDDQVRIFTFGYTVYLMALPNPYVAISFDRMEERGKCRYSSEEWARIRSQRMEVNIVDGH